MEIISAWEWERLNRESELNKAKQLYLDAKSGKLANCRSFLNGYHHDRIDWFNLWLDYLQLRNKYNSK